MANRVDDYPIGEPFARTAVSFLMNSRDFTGGLTEVTYKTAYMSSYDPNTLCQILCEFPQKVFTLNRSIISGDNLVGSVVDELVAEMCGAIWKVEPEDTPFFKAIDIHTDTIILVEGEDRTSRSPAFSWRDSSMPCMVVNFYNGMIHVSDYVYKGVTASRCTSWPIKRWIFRSRPVAREIIYQYQETEPLREMECF